MKAKSMYPFVSVIVITYNAEKTIGTALNSLMNLDYPKHKYEIIVVDGNSKDRTLKTIRRYAVKCIIEKRKGVSIARNTGIRNAKGEIIAFCDADCEVDRRWLSFHVQEHLIDDRLAAAGGAVISPSDRCIMINARHCTQFGEFSICSPKRYVCLIPTCNISFKKKILARIGPFDERLHAYEDSLLCWKIVRNGYKILFNPKIYVKHLYDTSNSYHLLWSFLEKQKLMGKSHYLVHLIDDTYPYRLPQNSMLAFLMLPMIILGRMYRQHLKMLKYSCKKSLPFGVNPYIIMGAVWWSLGYVAATLKQGYD